MKKLLLFASMLIFLASCQKQELVRYYKVNVSKSDTLSALLIIEDKEYRFTEKRFQTSLVLNEYDVVTIDAKTSGTYLTVELLEDGGYSTLRSGIGNVWILLTTDGISASSGGVISPGGGSGGGSGGGGTCPTVQCSGTTQSGARCKRTTTNCSGRCWQH